MLELWGFAFLGSGGWLAFGLFEPFGLDVIVCFFGGHSEAGLGVIVAQSKSASLPQISALPSRPLA